MYIRPVEADFLHADRRTEGWTETTKLIVVFRNFANAPKTLLIYLALRAEINLFMNSVRVYLS